ncbi:MAG: threonine--tRNA ligase [Oscillospiraceae bacterium]|nr:threonine--tRNA ligase [Oscillospiraceae bacterium]
MIAITLKDGSVREYEAPISAAEITKSISMGLYRNACAVKVNGELCDLRTELNEDCDFEVLTFDDEGGKHAFWHTAAHVMAQAVQHLFPEAKFGIGPALENGWYYDIKVGRPLSTNDFEAIEAEMKKIVKQNIPVEKRIITVEEGREIFAGQDYKLELLEEYAEKGWILSVYTQGDFTDLCAGPHLMTTGALKAVKLQKVASAYWRADAANDSLDRLYGVAFPKASMLEEYLTMLEEAAKRDHRKIGKELGLFILMEEGPGFPFFLPKGMVLKNTLIEYWREVHKRYNYVEVSTPMILNRALWERSGHWGHYKQNMYTTIIDEEDFAIKPMNCPGGMLVYRSQPHSYKELPLRVGELGLVHRHELSGALHGLFRVRCFTQDDAHIFMTWDQMKDEIKNVVKLFDEVYSTFGLSYEIELSTMPEDHMGDEKDWEFAQDTLKNAILEMGKTYVINEGDGAFYGPKLDFHLEDSIGRTWQCGTIQLDMQLPERFELEYVGADGEKHRPVMIHRVVFGSIERFIGVITEHFAGAFPTWLAPVQVALFPIADRHLDYLFEVQKKLEACGIRCEVDTRNEKVGYKIREAQLQRIPSMLVAGDKDIENGVISVRSRKNGDEGACTVDEFVSRIVEEIKSKAL